MAQFIEQAHVNFWNYWGINMPVQSSLLRLVYLAIGASCCVLMSGFHGVALGNDHEKPIVGGEGLIHVGTKKDSVNLKLLAEVDTGADRTSIDAVGFDVKQLGQELSKGDEFEFWIVTERTKVKGSRPAKWEIRKKELVKGTYEGTKTINGKPRALVKLWVKLSGEKATQLVASLNDRNKRERVLLGEDWTDGKLVDTEKTFESSSDNTTTFPQ